MLRLHNTAMGMDTSAAMAELWKEGKVGTRRSESVRYLIELFVPPVMMKSCLVCKNTEFTSTIRLSPP